MKKSLFFISCLSLLIAGCSSKDTNTPEEAIEPGVRHLTVDIAVNCETPDTKAVKTGWEEGDKVYVVFDDHFGEGSTAYYMTMTYDGSSWTSSFSGIAPAVPMHCRVYRP